MKTAFIIDQQELADALRAIVREEVAVLAPGEEDPWLDAKRAAKKRWEGAREFDRAADADMRLERDEDTRLVTTPIGIAAIMRRLDQEPGKAAFKRHGSCVNGFAPTSRPAQTRPSRTSTLRSCGASNA